MLVTVTGARREYSGLLFPCSVGITALFLLVRTPFVVR